MLYITEEVKLKIIEEGLLQFPRAGYGFLLGFEKRDVRIFEKIIITDSFADTDDEGAFTNKNYIDASIYAGEHGLTVLGIFQTLPNQSGLPNCLELFKYHNNYSILMLSIWGGAFYNLQAWRMNHHFEIVEDKGVIVNDNNYTPIEPKPNPVFTLSYN